MILTCPSCATQYVVKDGAIPPSGRQVRCASCKHSWHQDPEGSASAGATPSPIAEPEPPPEAAAHEEYESLAEATLIEPRSGPEVEERIYEEAVIEGEADAPPATTPDETAPPADGAGQAAPPAEYW